MTAMNCKYACVAGLFLSIAVFRVVESDRTTGQGFDEPCHVGAGIEWLDRHTYMLDPVHPPLARYAITLPLYLLGARMPYFAPGDPRGQNYNDVGDAVLYKNGQYRRNLFLARVGIIPFLCLATIVLFLWTRRYFNNSVACVAVAMLTTTPSILAFSGMAYNDLPVAALQLTFLCTLTLWMEKPAPRMTILLGIVAGLAISTKFTSLLFLTACTLVMLLCRFWVDRRAQRPSPYNFSGIFVRSVAAGVLAVVVLWSMYGFSTGHVRDATGLSPTAMPSFQHFPGPLRGIARSVVLTDPVIPAPELINGFAEIWVANKEGPPAYLFGHLRDGGWWFFFPVAFALKTPLALFILAMIGMACAVRGALRQAKWAQLMPVVCPVAIIAFAMMGRYNVGTRYLLVIFPLLAILAGVGACAMWQLPRRAVLGKLLVASLLLWQAFATISAQGDFLAYFNELAPADPSKALVIGCDLDCGQDVFRLATELHNRQISHIGLAVWSSADITQIGMPDVTVLKSSEPVTGWVAVSARSVRVGDVLHKTYPQGSFDWLDGYQPVAHVGKTILLYHIPG